MTLLRRLPKQRRAVLAAAAVALPGLLAARGSSGFVGQRLQSAMGQGLATTQFYLYGRSHFTETGWQKHSAAYPSPDPLQAVDLSGHVYVVTGANAGIGREVTSFLAEKGAKVYMVCRSEARANAARKEIADRMGADDRLVVIAADVGLQRDVRRVAKVVASQEAGGIDGLVCNAGALMNERTLTDEGVEVTFASHFLCGAYLLTELLRPSLRAAGAAGREPRVVMVSSGGMYNTAFPQWSVAASMPEEKGREVPPYNGQLAYAYAKRGQVLLSERWAELEEKHAGPGNPVVYVSAHPGWVSTAAVAAAYGESAKWLEPMRNLWQGAEGLCWLCAAPASELQPGAFYLDREPQVKHLAGLFFTEGSYTQNSDEEVDDMLAEAARAVAGPAE